MLVKISQIVPNYGKSMKNIENAFLILIETELSLIIMTMMMMIRTEVFNVTSGSWRQLAVLNVGRGMHACAKYNGIIIFIIIMVIMRMRKMTIIIIVIIITIMVIFIKLGGVMIAGGWTNNNDPDFPGQEVTRTTEW